MTQMEKFFSKKIVMPIIKYNYPTQGCYKKLKSEGNSLFFFTEGSLL